ncbi:MAG: pyrrolo-quinoline quinone, partial [Acidobacteria bacterium]|nr:pyrrolo-quinoline quinone [Acidobacteriota bacterium]
GRLRNVASRIYASPVAAAGKIYFVTESGHVVIRKAGADHEVLGVHDLGEDCYATPAVVEGTLYVRTVKRLWAFR